MAPSDMSSAGPTLGVVRPRLLVPGIPAPGLGVERYRVIGGGSTVFTPEAGDSLRIWDREGRQPGELVAFDKEAKAGPGALGAKAEGGGRRPQANTGAG